LSAVKHTFARKLTKDTGEEHCERCPPIYVIYIKTSRVPTHT
jgi:hypothetical protein